MLLSNQKLNEIIILFEQNKRRARHLILNYLPINMCSNKYKRMEQFTIRTRTNCLYRITSYCCANISIKAQNAEIFLTYFFVV